MSVTTCDIVAAACTHDTNTIPAADVDSVVVASVAAAVDVTMVVAENTPTNMTSNNIISQVTTIG